jgi:hypothetical protein
MEKRAHDWTPGPNIEWRTTVDQYIGLDVSLKEIGENIGLCWLPAETAEQPGATFTIYREGKLVKAVVHHGACYDADGERLRM